MKTRLTIYMITAILCFTFILPGYGQSGQEALAHMTAVQEPAKGLESELWKYLRTMARSKNEKRIEKRRYSLVENMQTFHAGVSNVAPYAADDSYRLAMLDYLDVSIKVINEDYASIMDLEEIMERSFDDFEAYVLAKEAANEKIEAASNVLDAAERRFAESNGISLVETQSRTSQKIAKANAAFGHYNDVHLLLMKCNYQEGYVMDAMNREDVNGMKQNLNTLAAYANEGLEQIESIEAHNGDSKLKYAAKRWLQFYKKEAEKDLVAQMEFYIAKDEFDKATKKIESIKPKKRTRDDVKNYNAQVDQFNKTLNNYNRTNETLNAARTKVFNDWNTATDNFMNTHVD